MALGELDLAELQCDFGAAPDPAGSFDEGDLPVDLRAGRNGNLVVDNDIADRLGAEGIPGFVALSGQAVEQPDTDLGSLGDNVAPGQSLSIGTCRGGGTRAIGRGGARSEAGAFLVAVFKPAM